MTSLNFCPEFQIIRGVGEHGFLTRQLCQLSLDVPWTTRLLRPPITNWNKMTENLYKSKIHRSTFWTLLAWLQAAQRPGIVADW